MKQLITKFKLASVFILVLLLGCETDDNVLLPQILSSFTYTLDEDTGTVEFINISEKATSYEWDFGDGETSTEINPIKTYVASGTYTITLAAANTAGATSTFEDEITIVIKDPITLPITFDETNVNYALGVSTFTGAAFEIVDNPDVSGTNDMSSNVGKITNSGAEYEGIYFDLGTPIDLSTDQTIKANFWSEEPIDILMKLELGTGSDTEVTVSHGGTGWETISFNFASTESYSRITLFVDGPGTTSGDFFIDDVEQAETVTTSIGCADTPVAAASVPVDFEGCETFLSSENFGDGITSGLAQNPDKTGINTSDFVLQVDKPTGSSFFAGIQNTFENNFDLTTTDVFKLKVYSTKANVVFRFELALNPQTDPVTGNPAPVFVTIPNANEWTEVEVNFTGLPGGPTAYNQLVIKPDNDEVDSPITEDGTYYIDDITLGTSSGGGGGGGASLDDCGGDLVNDFETDTDAIFDNFGGGVGTIIDNPDTSVNTSAKVGQYVKNAGEVFGGVTIEVDPDIDFDSGVFSIDVYSEAVRQLLFKLEGLNIEVVVPTSGTGWETLTYDFSSVGGNVGSVTAITLIMDNGTQGDGSADWTIQFDNIRLCSNNAGGGGGGGASLDDCGGDLVNDFETDTDAIFNNFGGGVGTIIDNPDTSVNTSAKVGQYVKNAGEVFGGVTIEVDPDIDFDSGVFSIDVYSEAVRQLLFKLEGLNIEVVVPTSGTGWETLTYDFSAVGGNVGSVTAITLIMDNGTQGDGSADWTIQFDNIRLCSNNAGGGGGGGASLDDCGGDLVNDFETDTDAIFNNFGGGVGTIIDNPDTSVNTSAKVGQYVKNAGEVFGGVTIEVDPDIDFDSGVFSIDVYSEAVRQLLFKLEGLNIEVVVPTSGTGWETLTYDFSSVGGNVGSVTAITLIMDNGTQGDGSADWTIQFDNIRLCSNNAGGGGGGGASLDDCGGDLVNDFETDTDAIFNNFGGGVGTIIDNPDTSVNTSAKVGQYVKNAGEVFGGITIEVDPDIDFDSGVFSIDVYSEAVRQLLFKLEGLNIEVVVPTSGTGWETLTYDFSAVGGNVGSVTAITLIMDNGTQGDGSADWTIQFDNIRLCSNNAGGGGGGGGPTALSSLPADFESGEEFGGVFEPASVDGSITANPVSGGINTSANVYTFNKPAGTEFYGGMENVFAAPLDLTTTRTFRVKVYSTKPNIIVQFELQSRPNDGSVPNYSIQQTVTNANEWVELTFDFGAIVPGSFNPSIYNAIVIIPDFDPGNNPTATSETYYIDDLILE